MKIDGIGATLLVLLGFFVGGLIFDGIGVGDKVLHEEKHGCKYVEKTECKQVWVRK